jgi:hypothetical protein
VLDEHRLAHLVLAGDEPGGFVDEQAHGERPPLGQGERQQVTEPDESARGAA